MAQKAYDDACLRAELFGQPLPAKEDFLAQHKHLDIVEFEEVDIRTAENTAMLTENMQSASGGLTELNTILNSTQTKINRLKGVCGSLTNFFRVKLTAKDNLSYSSEPSYVGQTNYDKDYIPENPTDGSINSGLGPDDHEMTDKAGINKNPGDINSVLKDLDEMETNNKGLISKHTARDTKKQVASQIDKLDQLINQADRAGSSLHHQNKQMRSMLR